MTATTNNTRNLTNVIAELKEYMALEAELKKQISALQTEAIDIMNLVSIDEYDCEAGKITYREVISKRFATTEFKKQFSDLYDAFCKPTTAMRFTCN